ncbi:sulfite efflux pump SSU1 [Aspergillus californicus]
MATDDQKENLEESAFTKHDIGWRRVVRNFTPSWFTVTMGTGIVSTLLNTLPYNGRWLYWISVIFRAMMTHPIQSMFIGTLPMRFATIVNKRCSVCVPAWGEWPRDFAWAIWIIDAVISVVTALSLPFMLMSGDDEMQLSSMTAVWLLPIVGTVVAASTGAIVADLLPNPQHALWNIIVSYVLWGVGLPLAMMVMVIYLQRLTLHKIPPKAMIVSVFLPLGPLGQGGSVFRAMRLGRAAQTIFPKTHTLEESSGPILYSMGFLVGLILWSFGPVWLFFESASIARCKTFPFNIGCMGTLKGMISGHIFHAPCLADLRVKEEGKGDVKVSSNYTVKSTNVSLSEE